MIDLENVGNKAFGKSLNSAYLNNEVKIPLPPIDIQRKIVSECETVDEEYNNSRMSIEGYKKKIAEIFERLDNASKTEGKRQKISEIGQIKMCKRIMKFETNQQGGIPFYKIGTFGSVPDAYISKELFENYKTQYPYPKKGQILISAAGTLGKSIAFDGEPAYFQDSNIVWIDNDESKVLNPFLLRAIRFVDWSAYMTDGSVIPRIYNSGLRNVTIPVPSIEDQQRIVSEIESYEAEIAKAKAVMAGCAERKKQILEKWLR